MILLAPRSTLFPYTTLFRSGHRRSGRPGTEAPRFPHRGPDREVPSDRPPTAVSRSEEHTSELQSHSDLVCRLLLEKKNRNKPRLYPTISSRLYPTDLRPRSR